MACNARYLWWSVEDPWGWVLCSQNLQVAILNLDTFLCQQPKLGVCGFLQTALAAASVSPIDQCYIWDQSCLGQRSACVMGRTILATDTFRSCVGAQPAPATGLALAHVLSCLGTLWAWQQTESPELCTSDHRVWRGIQLFSSSETYYGTFTSIHPFISQFFHA